jgi:hypothetical protein
MTEEATIVTEGEAEVEIPQDEPATITVNDLADCVKIIDICAKRGAFEGSELELIGQVRSRLVNFVNSTVPPEEATDEEATETEGE